MKRRYIPRPAAVRLAVLVLLVLVSLPYGISSQTKTHRTGVTYRNVTLQFDASLAKGYSAETVSAVPLMEKTDKPDGVAPEHIMITLRSSYAARIHRDTSSMYARPRIFVYPAADPTDSAFNVKFPTVPPTARGLRKLLRRRAGSVTESIPFLPWADEHQVFIGRKKLIRFRNGRGVLFLTQYAQEQSTINNSALVYTFQGLTDDNAWYVSAVFPVSAPGLPASASSDVSVRSRAAYGAYVKQTTERLSRLPARKFTPDLVLLEKAVRSLRVGRR